MTCHIHRLYVPLVFPAGLAPGEGGDYNILTIARNGMGIPVLRGTALTGALRHSYRKSLKNIGVSPDQVETQVNRFFGYALLAIVDHLHATVPRAIAAVREGAEEQFRSRLPVARVNRN